MEWLPAAGASMERPPLCIVTDPDRYTAAARAACERPVPQHSTPPASPATNPQERLQQMGSALEFTDSNFQSDVLESSVPVLVDFWAPWCGPCRMIGPTIEELAVENAGSFKVGKVNVDDNNRLAMTYNVASIPTIMIFNKGQLVQQFMGVQSKAKLQQALDEAKSA
jgi:thioredoxin 1